MSLSVAVRPEKIRLQRDPPSDPHGPHNRVQGTVRDLSYFGSFTVYHLQLESGATLKVSQSNDARPPRRSADLGRHGLGLVVAHRASGADGMTRRLGWLARGRTAVIGVPYIWLVVFFLIPFLVVLKISVSEMGDVAVKDVLSIKDGALQLVLRGTNYVALLQDDLYIRTYLSSLKFAAVTTVLCLFIGYPFSYFMARAKATVQPALLMLVMLPFWTSFLLRVYAWKGLLDEGGWVHQVLTGMHFDALLAAAGLIATEGKLMEHAVLAGDRHGLQLPAVHDPAALFDPLEDGPAAARSRVRPRRHAVAGLLAHHRAALEGRHRRRGDAGVHSLHRRIRDPPSCSAARRR